ncbi:MAG: DMT family transporter [Candidatus Krumholzibacteria bacterium]|nr:DMT family transporter [Candidatus Krumholzibacteria bacterium]
MPVGIVELWLAHEPNPRRTSSGPHFPDQGSHGVAVHSDPVRYQLPGFQGHRNGDAVGRSALICSQIPTFVLLFSVLARQEILTWRKSLGFAAGIAGVMVLLGADRFTLDHRYLSGDLLTLTNAASYALFVVLSRRVMARNDPLAATAVIFFFGAVGMTVYGGSSLLATDFSVITPELGWVMVYVIIGATVVTYFLNLWAVKRVQATRVALYIFLQPVIAAVLGVVFRGENITPRFLVATALIFTALLLRDSVAKTRTVQ